MCCFYKNITYCRKPFLKPSGGSRHEVGHRFGDLLFARWRARQEEWLYLLARILAFVGSQGANRKRSCLDVVWLDSFQTSVAMVWL